jgi:hypothetical protein
MNRKLDQNEAVVLREHLISQTAFGRATVKRLAGEDLPEPTLSENGADVIADLGKLEAHAAVIAAKIEAIQPPSKDSAGQSKPKQPQAKFTGVTASILAFYGCESLEELRDLHDSRRPEPPPQVEESEPQYGPITAACLRAKASAARKVGK